MQVVFLFGRRPHERTVAMLGENANKELTALIFTLPQQLSASMDCNVETLQMMMLQEGLLVERDRDTLLGVLRQMTRSYTRYGFAGSLHSPFDTFNDFAAVMHIW